MKKQLSLFFSYESSYHLIQEQPLAMQANIAKIIILITIIIDIAEEIAPTLLVNAWKQVDLVLVDAVDKTVKACL